MDEEEETKDDTSRDDRDGFCGRLRTLLEDDRRVEEPWVLEVLNSSSSKSKSIMPHATMLTYSSLQALPNSYRVRELSSMIVKI